MATTKSVDYQFNYPVPTGGSGDEFRLLPENNDDYIDWILFQRGKNRNGADAIVGISIGWKSGKGAGLGELTGDHALLQLTGSDGKPKKVDKLVIGEASPGIGNVQIKINGGGTWRFGNSYTGGIDMSLGNGVILGVGGKHSNGVLTCIAFYFGKK